MNSIGLYIHVPFCNGKCPYCDFYSLSADEGAMEGYFGAMEETIAHWAAKLTGTAVKTIYFGGGTPNLLGARRLSRLLSFIQAGFSVAPDAEITLEANPTQVDEAFFSAVFAAGFNRLSMGLQSADEEELRLLGRKHSPQEGAEAVKAAQKAGFSNISLDLMLGLPKGSDEKLGKSIDFAADLGVQHISCYILKVEEGTPFAAAHVALPDDDFTAAQYLFAVEKLKSRGFFQYEISNFSRPDKESRHNLVYWQGEQYLGIGPAAHSFLRGRRFFYPRSLEDFIIHTPPQQDGEGGSFEEFAMLNLRLNKGLSRKECAARFGKEGEERLTRLIAKARALPPQYISAHEDALAFTPQGFLVSNALLVKLLDG